MILKSCKRLSRFPAFSGALLLLSLVWSARALAETEFCFVTPENVSDVKARLDAQPNSTPRPRFQTTRAWLVFWEGLTPDAYESTYAQISSSFFLSQFSMKRGYRLEPFFPLLFPKNPGELSPSLSLPSAPQTAIREEDRQILARLPEVRKDVNQTLHEIHREQFLIPLRCWCQERQIPLEYAVHASDFAPISFLLEDALFLRHLASFPFQDAPEPSEKVRFHSDFLAETAARQAGTRTWRNGKQENTIPNAPAGVLLLVPDGACCGILEDFREVTDCAAEFQLAYASVSMTSGASREVRLGIGPMVWSEVVLAEPRSHFSQAAQEFLERFEGLGGKIKIKKTAND